MGRIKYLIFDMDDTLASTAPIWNPAKEVMFQFLGTNHDPEIAKRYRGMHAFDVAGIVFEAVRPPHATKQQCGKMLRDAVVDSFQTRRAEAKSGADDLLGRIAGKFAIGLASGSPLEGIMKVLADHNWTDIFDVVVSSEEVENGKPAPDVYLETMKRLNGNPEQTLAFEDSLAGIKSAQSAGMRCFVVPSKNDPDIIASADRIFESLGHISLEDIADLA